MGKTKLSAADADLLERVLARWYADDDMNEAARQLKTEDIELSVAVAEAKSGNPDRLHGLLNDLLSRHSSLGNIFGPGKFTAKPPPHGRRIKSDLNPFAEHSKFEPEERLRRIRRVIAIIQEEAGLKHVSKKRSHPIAANILKLKPHDIESALRRGSPKKKD